MMTGIGVAFLPVLADLIAAAEATVAAETKAKK